MQRGLALAAEGADLVDVGAESGVTYSPPATADEEAARVVPLVERLVAEGVSVSVDTWKPEVARAALDAGAVMLNDVSGLRDPALAELAARTGAALVLMHTRAEPKREAFPDYDDVVADVEAFLRERIALARAHGVDDEQLVLDPGPDFAKTPEQTVAVLRELDRLHALGRPLLLAVSRKYFLGAITGRPPAERLAGTLAAARGRPTQAPRSCASTTSPRCATRSPSRPSSRAAPRSPRSIAGDEELKWIRADR